jgi:L-ascorbate metabolism protein UlaG (beta-lactamase superfamily)
MSEPLYLRQNVQVEPLVDRWYAWSQLIPPATAARNITERHLNIMDSYIAAPRLHAAAVRNPKMLGGPFIDYNGQRVDEIRALRDRTVRDRAGLVSLSRDLGELGALLNAEARGFSLHPVYDRVPQSLQGYVELTYDGNNHPSFRLLEPLLYRSRYYDTSSQSLMLSLTTGDDRPFVLSTPRLPLPGHLEVKLPFDDERIDALFRLKAQARSWSEIRGLFELGDDHHDLFRSFFTPDPPRPYEPYAGTGLRWRYFGHACVLIETGGTSILFDPVLSYTYESEISRYTYLDLPDTIDYVLISHNHIDHILFETMLQLRHKIRHVVVARNGGGALYDPSLALTLRACGFRNVIELAECEDIVDDAVTITALPFFGEHGDLGVGTKLGYGVRAGGHSLLFLADSCNVAPALYEHLHAVVGDVDVLFIGMECNGAPMSWLYGPLMLQKTERAMDESRRLSGSNYDQAMNIVERFGVQNVYVYAMGQEPWLNYVMSIKYTEQSRPIVESNRLLQECRAQGRVAERLFGEREVDLRHRPLNRRARQGILQQTERSLHGCGESAGTRRSDQG